MENMFSKNLDYILKTRKFTTQQILKITGHNSKSLISMWKSGERFITTEDAVKLANALGCTIDDLINKDLREIQKQDSFTETFLQNKNILNEDDIETIKFIIEKRAKENDRQNN